MICRILRFDKNKARFHPKAKALGVYSARFLNHFAEPFVENIDIYDYYICDKHEYPELAKDLFEHFRYDTTPPTINDKYVKYIKEWWDTHDGENPMCFYEWEQQQKNLD